MMKLAKDFSLDLPVSPKILSFQDSPITMGNLAKIDLPVPHPKTWVRCAYVIGPLAASHHLNK